MPENIIRISITAHYWRAADLWQFIVLVEKQVVEVYKAGGYNNPDSKDQAYAKAKKLANQLYTGFAGANIKAIIWEPVGAK